MPDQEITFTLYKKQETEPFIKVSYKDSNNDSKEIQLTGDASLDSINMVKLFSESLSADFVNDYKSIKSNHQESNDINGVSQQPLLPQVDPSEANRIKLSKTKRETFYSDKLPIADIVSALSNDNSKITKFNKKVVYTLLDEFTTLKSNNYNKYIKKDLLSLDLITGFNLGINVDEVKAYILDPLKIDMNDKDIISKLFTDEFLNKYSGNITNWGREVLESNTDEIIFSPMSKTSKGGNNSSQKIRKIHNKTHRKK